MIDLDEIINTKDNTIIDPDVSKMGLESKYQKLIDIWDLKLRLAGRVSGSIKIDENKSIVVRDWAYYLQIKEENGYCRQLKFSDKYNLLQDFTFNKDGQMQGVCLKYFSSARTKDWKIRQYPKVRKGNISLYLNADKGENNGLCIQYHENGIPHIAALYKNNKFFGEYREVDKERNLISARFYYPEAMDLKDAKFYGYYQEQYRLPPWDYLCNPC
jgi:hypothetical protein